MKKIITVATILLQKTDTTEKPLQSEYTQNLLTHSL